MKPVLFPGCNTVYGKNQPEYVPLPAQVNAKGEVTSCWELTPEEVETIKVTGQIFVTQLTFNRGFQPTLVSVDWPEPLQETKS